MWKEGLTRKDFKLRNLEKNSTSDSMENEKNGVIVNK